jgi:hypothetical protein
MVGGWLRQQKEVVTVSFNPSVEVQMVVKERQAADY